MLTLMISLQLSVGTQEMIALTSLTDYLHTLARSNSGQVSDKDFGEYWNKICEVFSFRPFIF